MKRTQNKANYITMYYTDKPFECIISDYGTETSNFDSTKLANGVRIDATKHIPYGSGRIKRIYFSEVILPC